MAHLESSGDQLMLRTLPLWPLRHHQDCQYCGCPHQNHVVCQMATHISVVSSRIREQRYSCAFMSLMRVSKVSPPNNK